MNLNSDNNNECVTTAVLVAAGTGSRLFPLTEDAPKCLTLVNGVSILERLVICLSQRGFKRLVIVTGHLEKSIREFLGSRVHDIVIDYVFSPLYKTTNNIYSLWLVRKIVNEPFLLVESDLVFDVSLLDDMLYPDKIALARIQASMTGSTVTLNRSQLVTDFQNGIDGLTNETRYKTVNIYSFSLSSWHRIVERLDQHIKAAKVNSYYETVFAELVAEGSLSLQAVSFDSKPWYEIDTIEDLAKAEQLFAADRYTAPMSRSRSIQDPFHKPTPKFKADSSAE
jgi:choline kinase